MIAVSSRFGVTTVANGNRRFRYISKASVRSNGSPDDATITGSTTRAGLSPTGIASRMSHTVSMIALEYNIPVFMAVIREKFIHSRGWVGGAPAPPRAVVFFLSCYFSPHQGWARFADTPNK